MSETIALSWFLSLFGLAIVWLILLTWFFHRLRTRHFATYEAIGSPSLFWNNSVRNNWLFFKFLYQGRWQSLDDRALATVSRFMQVLLAVYMIGLIILCAVFLFVGIEHN